MNAQIGNLDPNDVESFEVLKDVSATALYGIRGSNGVIIINTKRGKFGEMIVSYQAAINVENPTRKLPSMSWNEFIRLSNKLGGIATDFGEETDWYDEILRTAVSNVHNISVSGGSETTKYYVSMNYRDVNGVLNNSGFDRFNTRAILSHTTLNDKLSLDIGIGATFENANLSNQAAFKYAAIYNPTASVMSNNEEYEIYDGYFQQVQFDYYNPVAMINQNMHKREDKHWNAQLSGTYELLNNLYFNVTYAIQTNSENENEYASKYSFGSGLNRNGFASKQTTFSYFRNLESSFSWQPILKNAHLNLKAGYAFQEFVSEGFSANGGDFISDAFLYNRLSAAADFNRGLGDVSSYKNSNKIIGFFGMANLNLKDIYFLSLVGRSDGSSRFGINDKYEFFPGISAGVNFANIFSWEEINVLKLRCGFGKSGQDILLSYRSLALYEPWDIVYYSGDFINTYQYVNTKNPALKSAVKTELNVGLDFQLLNGKVGGSLDIYSNKTLDLPLPYSIDNASELGQIKWLNIGELINKGWELNLYVDLLEEKSFRYQPSIFLTGYMDNSFGSLSDPESGYEFGERWFSPGIFWGSSMIIRMTDGAPVGEFWGYVFEGISDDGSRVLKDIDNNGQVDFNDRMPLGKGLPDYELGIGNRFAYKN